MRPLATIRVRTSEQSRWLVAAVAFVLGACASDPTGASSSPTDAPLPQPSALQPEAEPERAGSLSLSLSLTGELRFDTFDYVITGPDFTKTESIDVSKSNTVSVLVGAIPVGSDYAITLSGTALSESTQCSGSARFAIVAGAVTELPVAISCHAQSEPGAELPTPAPLPTFVPAALGLALGVVGMSALRRRRESLAE